MTLVVSPTATASCTAGTAVGWGLIATSVATPGQPPVGVLLAVTDYKFDQAEYAAAHYGLGAPLPVIITDVVGGRDGQITVQTFEDTTYTILAGLLTSQSTLWLTSPYGEGWYVRAGVTGGSQANPSSPSSSPAAVKTGSFAQDAGAARVRSLTIVYVEQPRP